MRGMSLVLSCVSLGSCVPAAQASPCEVSIVRAPEAVRGAIERWVQGEPSCGGPLEVRVVETERGLYVTATDAARRTFDRVVPDAESAGALVASWAVAATPARGAPDRVALAIPPESAALYGLRPPATEEPAAVEAEAPSRARERLVAITAGTPIGFLFDGDLTGMARAAGGVGAQLDLARTGRWSAGAGAGFGAGTDEIAATFSVGARGYGAWTSRPGTWRFRAELGLGVSHGWTHFHDRTLGEDYAGTVAPIDVVAQVSRQVNARWAIGFGPYAGTLAPLVPRSSGGSVGTTIGLHLALQGAL